MRTTAKLAARCLARTAVALATVALVGACAAPRRAGPSSEALIGHTIPQVAFRWLEDGSEGSLTDLRGRVVLLVFWRTLSEPCLQQVPTLDALQERYEEDGLTVVGISSEEEELVRTRSAEAGVRFPLALVDGEEVERRFGITAVPRAFLIDREGVLVWVGHPGTLEEGRLRELLFER